MKRFLLLTAVFLCLGMLLCGCKGNEPASHPTTQAPPQAQDIFSLSEIGNGEKSFLFEVHLEDGSINSITVNTDKNTVGEALLEYAIIDGEQGDYGLYVKSVNGIIADYDVNGAYWAFYINGNYAPSGVDLTEINENDVYSFRYEKG
ncbi:MAG: DUF4430 domain-containing protein [Clostridia bacterium]|nr:DUF4430 domain-containing protein [Clostridia bacterium]